MIQTTKAQQNPKNHLKNQNMKPHFKFLTGDVNWLNYGGKWISQKLSDGKFNYFLVIELINWEDACGELSNGNKYNVSLAIVSPESVGEEKINKAKESMGLDSKELDEKTTVEILHSYGLKADIWGENGNNAHKLINLAKKEANSVELMVDVYLDKQLNKIGSTAREIMVGDYSGGIQRTIESGTQEGKILAKIYSA